MSKTNCTTNVVSLADFRAEKQTSESNKQVFRDSLDNYKVKQSYSIPEVSMEERMAKIQASIKRVNSLISELDSRVKS
jgi:hypothetical protein